jgi:hypothetical protein
MDNEFFDPQTSLEDKKVAWFLDWVIPWCLWAVSFFLFAVFVVAALDGLSRM